MQTWFESYESAQGFISGFHDRTWDQGPPPDWDAEHAEAEDYGYFGVLR